MNDLLKSKYNFYKQNYNAARKVAREYNKRYNNSLDDGSSQNIVNYLYRKSIEKNLICRYSELALNDLCKTKDDSKVDEINTNVQADYNAAEYIFNNGIDIKRKFDDMNYGYVPPLDLGNVKKK